MITQIRTKEEFYDLFLPLVKKEEVLCYDLETANTNRMLSPNNRILCAGFCWDSKNAYVVPVEKYEGFTNEIVTVKGMNPEEVLSVMNKEIFSEERQWIGQNLKFDYGYSNHFNIEMKGRFWDTLAIENLLDVEAFRKDLGSLINRYLPGITGSNYKDKPKQFIHQYMKKFEVDSCINECNWWLNHLDSMVSYIDPAEIKYLKSIIHAIEYGVKKKVGPKKYETDYAFTQPEALYFETEVVSEKTGKTRIKKEYEIFAKFKGTGGLKRVMELPKVVLEKLENNELMFDLVPAGLLFDYCGKDVIYTMQVFEKQLEILMEDPESMAVYEAVNELPKALSMLELNGVLYDKEQAIGNQCLNEERFNNHCEIIKEIAYQHTDWSKSTCMTLDLGKAGAIPSIVRATGIPLTKRTPTGKIKFTSEIRNDLLVELTNKLTKISATGTLEEIKTIETQHTLIESLDQYAYLKRKISNYFVPLIARTEYYDRIHASFIEGGARTSRLSSRDPNLQNIDKIETDVRSCFICEPDEILVELDMRQFEPRITAGITQDKKMLDIFSQDKDFYNETARWSEELAPDYKIPKELRDLYKSIVLGMNYNMSAYGLAAQLKCAVDYAEDKMSRYRNAYSTATQCKDDWIKELNETGISSNWFGRKRDVTEKLQAALDNRDFAMLKHLENVAANNKIQSTASEIQSRIYVALFHLLWKTHWGEKIKMLIPVHDSILFAIKMKRLKECVLKIKSIMEFIYVPEWGVSFPVDMKLGLNWGEMIEYKTHAEILSVLNEF